MFKIVKCENCDGKGYLVRTTPARYHGKIEPQPECTIWKGLGTVTKPA